MRFFAILAGLLLSSAAFAQDYGLTLGFHESSASVDNTALTLPTGVSGSVSGKLGFEAGVLASFELVPNLRFRTGLVYDQEQFDYKITGSVSGTVNVNFAYLDVPVDVQYNFNPMFGVYGGLIVGIKASDSVNSPFANMPDVDMKAMYPFLNVGVNLTFDDMYGFDIYDKMGLGSAADYVKNYNTFGLNFVYWL